MNKDQPVHHPKVVKNYGVPAAFFGYQRLAVRGFRAYCPDCGQLGAFRLNNISALSDRDAHAKGRSFPTPRR